MKKEQEYLESLIFFMKDRVEFLMSSIDDNEKEIKENDGYAKGIYKGLQMAQQDEIDFLRSNIDYFNKKRNSNSNEAV
ncbi:hypothetical protein [Lysinibacillus capsici]|uniref:hypothetical protein n=1 Tax=Lysinibacillus capsici TaxID=2115968 RepID=UPI0034E25BB5